MPRRIVNLGRQLIAEHRPLRSLERLQLRRLQALVHEAYRNTTFYRTLMQRAGVKPGQIRALEDLRRLPIITKEDFREFSPQECANQQRLARYGGETVATSGSSGEPFEFMVDGIGSAWRKAQYLRPYVTNGRRPWHRTLRLTAVRVGEEPGGSGVRFFRERKAACTSPVARQVDWLLESRPHILQGYPSALRAMALEIRRREIPPPPLTGLFTDSEMLTVGTRNIIEEAFASRVLDVFGAFETDNMAYQCQRARDHHVAVDSVIAEVIRDGDQIESGEGDLVTTVLNNLATPFIRYRLGDRVSPVRDACPCGRTFPLIRIEAGRSDDRVVAPDGSLRSPMSFLWRFDSLSELVLEYQVVQQSPAEFLVRIVPARALSPADEQRIREVIRKDFPAASVRIEQMTSIPRTPAQKLMAFVNEIPPGNRSDGR